MKDTDYKRKVLRAAMEDTQGKFFTVKFTKKNGEERTMNARLGVKAPLKGGSNTTEHLDQYVTVYEGSKRNYRNVNLDTIHELHASGTVIKFERSA